MKLQRFIGKNTKAVLDEIRTTLGEEALIVSNSKVGSKTEIIAACETRVEKDEGQDAAIGLESRNKAGNNRQNANFASLMSTQEKLKTETEEVDPWTYIQSINQEINYIKSSLEQLPKLSSEVQESNQIGAEESVGSEEPLRNILSPKLQKKIGSHIIWGHRESGKSTLIKELLKNEILTNEHVTIMRLPHKHSNIDPHLSAIAERYAANLIYVNNLDRIEKMIDLFGKDKLILLEADLSLLPKLAIAEGKTWLEASFHYLLNEDQEQTKLLLKLFSEIQTSEPVTLNSVDIKKTI